MITANTPDAALTQLHDLSTVFEGSEAVGYDQQGEVLVESFDGLHDGLFGFVVQRTGGFVKDDDIGLLVKSASNTDALTLAAREADAAFTDKCLVFLGPAFDGVGNLCLLRSLPDALVLDLVFGDAKGDVFFNAAIGKKDGLRHMSDMGLPGALVAGCYSLAIYLQLAIRGLQ